MLYLFESYRRIRETQFQKPYAFWRDSTSHCFAPRFFDMPRVPNAMKRCSFLCLIHPGRAQENWTTRERKSLTRTSREITSVPPTREMTKETRVRRSTPIKMEYRFFYSFLGVAINNRSRTHSTGVDWGWDGGGGPD